jgi:SAM-dependent MidA family methyltransferase
MSSEPSASATLPSAAFLERFHARAAAAQDGIVRFDAFVDLALYDPVVGYYRQDRARVGYGAGTDFYTASTSGPLFGELVSAACATLLAGEDLSAYTFVEIGAESPEGILAGVAAPFGARRTVAVGNAIEVSGRCIVFSNELFDAQPFRRWVWRGSHWREIGVVAEPDGHGGQQLREALLPLSETIEPAEPHHQHIQFPNTAAEGYVLDLPVAANALLSSIAAQTWQGLFVAFDYGKSWAQLAHETPGGTARAYFRHEQHNDLLARPGHQDLTCHVVWDWLAGGLKQHCFQSVQVESQESFFVHHAGNFISQTMAAEATRMSARKLSLMQLLHPANLGQKFQVLHGLRR